MSAATHPWPAPAASPDWAWRAFGALAAGSLAAALGAMAAMGLALPAAGLLVFTVFTLVGLANWRWPIYALIVYLPFSGIPIIASYPQTGSAVLVKDFAFVIPAYIGFFAAAVVHRKQIRCPGLPVLTGSLFAAIVLAQALNPSVPSPLVAAVGIKVWLLYLPMAILGYHLVDSRKEVGRLLALMTITALVPAGLGIIEAIAIYSGHAETVYGWYGAAADPATQHFAALSIGGAELKRVPSTFSFGSQYFAYLTCMVAVAYAWWRGGPALSASGDGRSVHTGLAAGALATVVVAAFLSGARGAFVLVPLILVIAIVLDRRRAWSRGLPIAAVALAGLLLAIGVVGASSVELIRSLGGHLVQQFDFVFTQGLRATLDVTTLGLGTGTNTNSARHVVSDPTLLGIGGAWQESWYVKGLVELGILGLALMVAFLAVVVGGAVRRHLSLRDPALRSVSAGLLALVIVQLAYSVKASNPDLDPLNVYLWLYVGLLAKIWVLDDSS